MINITDLLKRAQAEGVFAIVVRPVDNKATVEFRLRAPLQNDRVIEAVSMGDYLACVAEFRRGMALDDNKSLDFTMGGGKREHELKGQMLEGRLLRDDESVAIQYSMDNFGNEEWRLFPGFASIQDVDTYHAERGEMTQEMFWHAPDLPQGANDDLQRELSRNPSLDGLRSFDMRAFVERYGVSWLSDEEVASNKAQALAARPPAPRDYHSAKRKLLILVQWAREQGYFFAPDPTRRDAYNIQCDYTGEENTFAVVPDPDENRCSLFIYDRKPTPIHATADSVESIISMFVTSRDEERLREEVARATRAVDAS